MLVLRRRRGDRIVCTLPDGGQIVIRIIDLDRSYRDGQYEAKIGIEAPQQVLILRGELESRQRHE